MRLVISVLGAEVFAVELARPVEPTPSLEGGSGGWFELAGDEALADDEGGFGFRS